MVFRLPINMYIIYMLYNIAYAAFRLGPSTASEAGIVHVTPIGVRGFARGKHDLV